MTHHIIVTLDPDRHRLVARDRMMLQVVSRECRTLAFSLHSGLHVKDIVATSGGNPRPLSFTTAPETRKNLREATQSVTVQLGPPGAFDQTLTLEWHYEGAINDPPREARHLRFVTPSETAGHIGSEGVYLSGETHWYPDLPGSISTFRVTVTTPRGWQAVSHGRLAEETVQADQTTSEWDVAAKTEALTLVANRFVKRQRSWNNVDVAAYLFPENAALAQEYLDASVKYLETYASLLGPYPFPKFAVVENFFASGLGMPSFTLLGSGVIKRHYIQPYALGHEIVHSWIGNWVFNDIESGNWVEGLTTYLANYYYDELTGTPEQATAQRRMMLLGYAVYVSPEDDYPVVGFRHKTDQKDNAIGYQKAAMIFHMLRREVGDEAFWQGIRTLITAFGGSSATWQDVERIFSEGSRLHLRWFFAQWVERQGAPQLALSDAQTEPVPDSGGKERYIKFRLVQKNHPFRLRLPLRVQTRDGRIITEELTVRSGDEAVAILISGQPFSLEIDPDYHVFRRIDRKDLPPMLNLFVTDHDRFVILPDDDSSSRQPYQDIVTRLKSQDAGLASVVVKDEAEVSAAKDIELLTGSVLVLGHPDVNRLTEWAVRGCQNRIHLERDKMTVDGRVYEGPDLAVLASCRHPQRPDHVATIFYGQTAATAAKIARLLFFYGWQSYMIFRDGAVAARGDFSPEHSPLEVRFDAF